jgi:hypothetical protein
MDAKIAMIMDQQRNDGGNLKPGFVFPKIEAETSCRFWAIRLRSPVTAISRPIMTHTIQAGTQPSDVIMIMAEDTSSLSATGSITFPKLDSNPFGVPGGRRNSPCIGYRSTEDQARQQTGKAVRHVHQRNNQRARQTPEKE